MRNFLFQPMVEYGTNIRTTGFFCLFHFVLLHLEACGILVLQPGIETGPLTVKAQSLNQWTAREFPTAFILNILSIIISSTRKSRCQPEEKGYVTLPETDLSVRSR